MKFCMMAFTAIVMLTSTVNAATVSWTMPTTYTDGSPLLLADIQKSTMYCDGIKQTDIAGPATSATVPDCNKYTATVTVNNRESPQSIPAYLDLRFAGSPVIVTQPCPVCNELPPHVAEVHLVHPWRTGDTERKVYALDRAGLKTDTVIGVIAVGSACTDFVQQYSANSKTLSWRRVTIYVAGGSDLLGATVCKKQ